jgi:hypothetical protein
MTKVRCKFSVWQNIKTEEGYNITLGAVTSGSPENEQFWKYTPAGSLNFNTINGSAAEQLIEGKEYYVDIIPCDNE